MVWSPGQSGNPNGYSGPRVRRRHEVFDQIKNLGHKDALITLSTLAHESQDEGIKMAAAAALAPYCHPKLQATPTPRFVEPIDVPDFIHVGDAESFLAKIAVLVARGQLDIQSGIELSGLVKAWIDAQYQREELAIKQINAGATDGETTIKIEGMLQQLPGTSIIGMEKYPTINDHATNGHALAPPTPAIESSANESVPAENLPETPASGSTDTPTGNQAKPAALQASRSRD